MSESSEGEPTEASRRVSQPEPTGSRTVPDAVDVRTLRTHLWIRRLIVLLLAVFVLLGLTQQLGVRHKIVEATSGEWSLQVEHAVVSRPGLDTPWTVHVRKDGGLPEEVVIRTTASYFDLFDENGLDPAPTDEQHDGKWLIWTFAPEPGSDQLTVEFDARISPAHQKGSSARTEVLDVGPELGVNYRTRLMP